MLLNKIKKYTELLFFFVNNKSLPIHQKAMRVNYYLSNITELVDLYLSPIRDIGVPPSEVKEHIKPLHEVINKILLIVPKLISEKLASQERIIEFLLIAHDVYPNKAIVNLLSQIIDATDSDNILSDIADRAYDIGLFDISYKALVKLIKRGSVSEDAIYNLALIEYMRGNNEHAYRLLMRLMARISRKRRKKWNVSLDQIYYLLGAVSLARGDITNAKKYFLDARKN